MRERIDRQYLRPQIRVIENALIEWTVIYIVFFSRFVYVTASEDPTILNFITTFIMFYAIFGLFYVGPRTTIASYFAFRKVVMAEDGRG